jgi:hypothetical protein
MKYYKESGKMKIGKLKAFNWLMKLEIKLALKFLRMLVWEYSNL